MQFACVELEMHKTKQKLPNSDITLMSCSYTWFQFKDISLTSKSTK